MHFFNFTLFVSLAETAMKLEGQVKEYDVYVEYITQVQPMTEAHVFDKTIIWHKPTGLLLVCIVQK